jgi:hypothetical protein
MNPKFRPFIKKGEPGYHFIGKGHHGNAKPFSDRGYTLSDVTGDRYGKRYPLSE